MNTFAPYVDVTLWPPYDIIGCANQTNQKFFTLAFLVSNQSNNLSWGGYYPLNDLSNTWFLDKITSLRAIGGDVIFSFGGATGQEISEVITDIPTLVNTYQNAINLYKMTAIDFDIEGAGFSNSIAIDRRNKALFILQQQNPDLKISYTLPVLPTGLTENGINLINNIITNNVKINLVNLMTMDYGMNIADMSSAAISAAASVNNLLQIKNLTNVKVGMTNMIGVNDTPNETFSLQNASTVLTYANANPYIGFLSIWSANRDIAQISASPNVSATYSGIIQKQFEFINIFKSFSSIDTTTFAPATTRFAPATTTTFAPTTTFTPAPTTTFAPATTTTFAPATTTTFAPAATTRFEPATTTTFEPTTTLAPSSSNLTIFYIGIPILFLFCCLRKK